jgi:aspartyl-tRNA(Asn)/glutamyl-tRNA(Gln) amidotransferase subunit C
MAVSEDDVRHVAELARLGLDDDRVEALVRELNGILVHMEALSSVDPAAYEHLGDPRRTASPLRPDAGPPIPLMKTLEDTAPAMRDGFFIVPRLATHEDGRSGSAP